MSEQNTGTTSSIGAAWPPVADNHNRLRGFYDEGVVDSNQAAQDFANQWHEARQRMATHPTCNRLSIRAVAKPALLATLEQLGVAVEAALPLAAPYDSLVVTYTGYNAPDRVMSEAHTTRHISALHHATAQSRRSTHPANFSLEPGFSSAFVDQNSSTAERQGLASQFAGLYAIFGYSADETKTLLSNPDNMIAYIKHNGDVVSTAMAECGTIPIKNLATLTIAEITEASTAPAYRGKGLYKAVSGMLTRRLIASRDLAAIYGESNLAMPGVLIAAHHNGRRFSHFDGAAYGIVKPSFGILPQNFSVQDGVETRAHNDFAVSYIPL